MPVTNRMLDNGGYPYSDQPRGISEVEPREFAIVAMRAGRPEHTPEAELVLVEVDEHRALLTLDDGETVEFDLTELRSALADAA